MHATTPQLRVSCSALLCFAVDVASVYRLCGLVGSDVSICTCRADDMYMFDHPTEVVS